jgi:hypothetical protein
VPRQLGDEHAADRHRLAVPDAVALGPLDRVAHGVAVVERLAAGVPLPGGPGGLLQVPDDDVDLDLDRALHQLAQHRAVGGERGGLGGLDELEDARVGDEAALDDLAHAGHQVGARQRPQQRQVAEHPGRLVEGTDEVLARSRVDAGLATHGGVDHRQQRGRHVHDRHAAQPAGGHPATEVGGGATAEGHHGVGAREAGLAEGLPAGGRRGHGLRGLAVGHDQLGRPVGVGQGLAHRRRQVAQRLRHHEGDPRGPVAQQPRETAGDPVADDDVVRRGARDVQHALGARAAHDRAPSSSDSTSSATSSGVRPSVSTVWVATEA